MKHVRQMRRFILLIFGVIIFFFSATRHFIMPGQQFAVGKNNDTLRQLPYYIQQINRSNSSMAPAYAPGMYMAGQRPTNISACHWNYQLPTCLSYSSSQIISSPEGGKGGPYRVLPFIIRNNIKSSNGKFLPKLTFCTHATADKVYNVVEIVKRWEGPVSFSIFAPGHDAALAVELLERACRCEPQMSKISVHLIFLATDFVDNSTINNKLPSTGDCTAWDLQWRKSQTERIHKQLVYPINVARNVARNLAMTSRVLVSDVELLPSEKLASSFMDMIHERPPRYGIIFVLPVFEIDQHQRPPKNKRELMAAITNGLAIYFHKYVCVHCQRFPGMTRWMLRPDPNRVIPLIVTKREYPYHRWEPLYIGTREDPLYNEGMSWEGRQDKMAQMLQICLMNYRLIILDGAFLVHSPGIKHHVTILDRSQNTTEHIHKMQNTHIYQSATRRLIKQYPINRKCMQ